MGESGVIPELSRNGQSPIPTLKSLLAYALLGDRLDSLYRYFFAFIC